MMCSLNQLIIMVLFVCSYWWLPCYSVLTSEKPQDGYDDGVSTSTSPPPAVVCENCNDCPNPCTPQPQQQPPPPPRKGSAMYTAPPPPPVAPGGANCPPVAPVTCCQYAPPNPMPNYGYPYDYGVGNFTQSSSFSRTPCLVMMVLMPFVYVFGV